jgi:glycerophosphoryl diester phosphodiesterase
MRPMVFAHRGGAALAPENTMTAFDNGLALGADGIELDVRLSRDGVAVVLHDPTLDRTTDATGPVEDRTAAELAACDAGYRFERDGAFPYRGLGLGVPALRDVLERYRGTALIVELKAADARLARVVVDDIRATAAAGRVTIGSFQKGALDAVRACDPSIRTGADMDEIRGGVDTSPSPGLRRQPAFVAFQVPEVYAGTRIVTPDFVARAHDAGVGVVVWTVDREDDIRRLLGWGVDGLITDRPDIAVPVVRAWIGATAAECPIPDLIPRRTTRPGGR